jgi:alkylhydroperoxidase/carboxymuconolactone decarboxylase family protein YurZ
MKKSFQPAAVADREIKPLADNPAYADLLADLVELEKLHSTKTLERARLLARAKGVRVRRSASDRAKDLLAGGRVDPTPPSSALDAIDQEIEILRSALADKSRELDAVAADASYEAAQALRPQFDAHMRAALAAMESVVAAFTGAASVADALRSAGYKVSSVVMPDLMPQGVRALELVDLQRFRQELSNRGSI